MILLVVSNLASAATIVDSKEKIQLVLEALKLLGEDVQIPTQASLDYNTGNGMLTRGSFVILNDSIIGQNKFECLIEFNDSHESNFVTQSEFMKKAGMDKYYCLNQNTNECFISIIPINLKNTHNNTFVAISSNTPPGTIVQCSAQKNSNKKFQASIIY